MAKDEIIVICMNCKKVIGKKDGKGVSGISHGLCPDCETVFLKNIAAEKRRLINENVHQHHR